MSFLCIYPICRFFHGWWIISFNFTVISNFSVRLSCVSTCMLRSCISLWISCRYCNLFSAQLCNRRCLLLVEFSLYLASRFVGSFGRNGVCEIWVREGVEGEKVSGSDKVVSDETSFGSFTKFGSPWEKACVIQNGGCSVVAGGLKGFSRICSDVGVDPK